MHTERANAKINAYLDVISRREDGYHTLISVMQTVSLCDLVSVDFQPAPQSEITLTVSGNAELPVDCRNLAWRAAEKFLQRTHLTGTVRMMIQKHIPAAAGLAGGSADAAAVLRALNHLAGKPLDVEALCALGLSIGADVPFCIHGGTMVAGGVGEELIRVPDMPFCHMVIAVGEASVSTPQAYAALDQKYGFFTSPREDTDDLRQLLKLWKAKDLAASAHHFYNIFEDVIASQNPDVEAIKRIMRQNGVIRAMMSGSGPAVFGVFDTSTDAENACTALQSGGYKAFVCHPRAQYTV